jgi:hypothetical protein
MAAGQLGSSTRALRSPQSDWKKPAGSLNTITHKKIVTFFVQKRRSNWKDDLFVIYLCLFAQSFPFLSNWFWQMSFVLTNLSLQFRSLNNLFSLNYFFVFKVVRPPQSSTFQYLLQNSVQSVIYHLWGVNSFWFVEL